jgi:hypothetical protein
MPIGKLLHCLSIHPFSDKPNQGKFRPTYYGFYYGEFGPVGLVE